MTHQYFADFSNFIAFGEYASIDLRVKVRRMVSGRPVKGFSVSTKLAEYTLQKGMYLEVVEALNKCFSDLVRMTKEQGYPELSDYILSNWTIDLNKAMDLQEKVMDYGQSGLMAHAIGQCMAFNYDWDQGIFSW